MSLPALDVALLRNHHALKILELSHLPKVVGQRWTRKAQYEQDVPPVPPVPLQFQPTRAGSTEALGGS
jgi:hypothetical protein